MHTTLTATVATTLKNMLALTPRWVIEFGFEVNINGSTLSTKVSEATMTGWKCSPVVQTIDGTTLPFRLILPPVNLITRTVPPVIKLTSTIKLTRKQTPPLRFAIIILKHVLKMVTGSARTIVTGID